MSGFRQLRDYFHFNQGERRGFIVLFSILTIIILFNTLSSRWFKPKAYDLSAFEKTVDEFYSKHQQITDSINELKTDRSLSSNTQAQLNPISFDPNTLSKEGWIRMGLSEKQTKVILNYRKKGGKFIKEEDLAKIYSLSEKEFLILKPYIKIKQSEDPNNTIHNHLNKNLLQHTTSSNDSIILLDSSHKMKADYTDILSKKTQVEINSADTLDLQMLVGIGPSFARRIIKYRQLLGGYVNKEQILEVYGMDSTRYEGLTNQITIDTSLMRAIPINQITIKKLIKHPYFDYYLAKSIISNRLTQGNFKSLEDFQSRLDLPAQILEKISHYLSISEQ